jgi:putative Mg2+ transporter-C (MgtC) family protein
MILLQLSLVRLGLAVLLGACVGALRASHPRSAWIGVHALLAPGSCLLTMTALLGLSGAPVRGQVQGDPTRIISWILLGGGWLAAASLFGQQGRPTVATLASATMFWVVAALGVLCGAGWLSAAVAGALMIVSIGLLSRLAKRYFSSR